MSRSYTQTQKRGLAAAGQQWWSGARSVTCGGVQQHYTSALNLVYEYECPKIRSLGSFFLLSEPVAACL